MRLTQFKSMLGESFKGEEKPKEYQYGKSYRDRTKPETQITAKKLTKSKKTNINKI